MKSTELCSACSAVVPSAAPLGLCPQCLFTLGLPLADAEPLEVVGGAPGVLAPRVTGQQRLGDYEVIDEIARGGMGIVYKARQLKLNRIVALKIISVGTLATPELIKRFCAEAEAAASLTHPNIVPIYEIAEDHGQHYFSMGWIEGPNLKTRLGHRPMSNPRAAAQLVCTLARAVHFAHQRGILHRDLKPSNVILDQNDQPHLTDFGLAKVVQSESDMTRTHAVLGTPAYMAPEQARGNSREVTTAVDVYGLGAVLYEALTGSAPFDVATPWETIRQVLEHEPRRPSLTNPAVDRDLETICLKCLEKEAAKRYASAEALAADLDRWLLHEPIQARPNTTIEHIRKWVERRPATAALAASLAFVLGLGGLGVTVQWRRAENNAASLRRHLYASDMAVAWHSWTEGDAQRTREQLVRAERRGEALRGFEWHYLWGDSQPAELLVLPNSSTSAKYLPGGNILAVAGFTTGTVQLWDVASQHLVRWIKAYPASCWGVAVSPDNRLLATCSRTAPDFKLWEIASGAQIGTLTNRDQESFWIGFAPNGKRVATVAATPYATVPAIVKVWEMASQKELVSCPGLTSMTVQADFSPDSETLAFGDGGGAVRLWNVSTGRVRLLPGHTGYVFRVRFSPGGKILASGDERGTVLLWDVASESLQHVLTGHQGSIHGLAISPNGQWLASAGLDHTVRLWDLRTGEEASRYRGHSGRVWSVEFSPDGHTLVTAAEDGVRFWKVGTSRQGEILRQTKSNWASYSPDGQWLLMVESGADRLPVNRVTLRHEANASNWLMLTGRNAFFSPDGKTLVLVQSNQVALLETTTMQPSRTISVGAQLTGAASLSPDGKWLAARSEVRTLVIDLPQAKVTATLGADSPRSPIPRGTNLLAFTRDSRTLITSDSSEGMIHFWDVAHGRPDGSLSGMDARIRSMSLSHDGVLLATASETTIRLWNLRERAPLEPLLQSNHGAIEALAFSPNDQTLAAGSYDGPIILWNVPTRQEIGTLKGHISNVWSLSFSPDGRTLTSSSFDGTVRRWRATNALQDGEKQRVGVDLH